MTSDSYPVDETHYFCEGRIWTVRPDAIESDYGVIHENWLADPYRLVGNVSGIVLDIGGNIGAFALRALREGAKRVYSFEPELSNLQTFCRNTKAEQLDHQIVLSECAVWSHSFSTVYLVPEHGLTVTTFGAHREGSVAVRTVSLAYALESSGDQEIDLLKIDTEGAEIEMLSTCHEELRRVKRIAMEYHVMRKGWGEMIRNLSGFFDLEIVGHNYPNADSGGMLYGTRR